MEDQRARLNVVVGTSRVGLGDRGGFDQIRDGLEIARASRNFDMIGNAYANLTSEFHIYAELDEARRAWRGLADLADAFGLRLVRVARAEGAGWAYLEGR